MSERGAATVVAMAIVTTIVALTAGLAAVGRLMAAHFQATAAADAAALAAAPLTFLPGDPLGEAREYARANGATLSRCSCPSDTSFRVRVVAVEVVDVVELPVFGEVEVRARAAAEFDPWQLLG